MSTQYHSTTFHHWMRNKQTGITTVSILFFWLSNLYISCVVIARLVIENCYRTHYFLYICELFLRKRNFANTLFIFIKISSRNWTLFCLTANFRAKYKLFKHNWTYSWLLQSSSDGSALEKRGILARQRELKRKWRCTAYG